MTHIRDAAKELEYSAGGFFENLIGGAKATVGGLVDLGQTAGTDILGELRELLPGDYQHSSTIDDLAPEILPAIRDHYVNTYGPLLPGGTPAGETAEAIYHDPFSTLLDASALGFTGLRAAKGATAAREAGQTGIRVAAEALKAGFPLTTKAARGVKGLVDSPQIQAIRASERGSIGPSYAPGGDARLIRDLQGEHRFMSNFAPLKRPVTLDGVDYPTVEHAYQAAKFADPKVREIIRAAKTPGEAKKLGRSLAQQQEMIPDFDTRKVAIMEDLVRQKFERNPELKKQLAETEDLPIEEGNYWGDEFWGVTRDKGGENQLGEILQRVRDLSRQTNVAEGQLTLGETPAPALGRRTAQGGRTLQKKVAKTNEGTVLKQKPIDKMIDVRHEEIAKLSEEIEALRVEARKGGTNDELNALSKKIMEKQKRKNNLNNELISLEMDGRLKPQMEAKTEYGRNEVTREVVKSTDKHRVTYVDDKGNVRVKDVYVYPDPGPKNKGDKVLPIPEEIRKIEDEMGEVNVKLAEMKAKAPKTPGPAKRIGGRLLVSGDRNFENAQMVEDIIRDLQPEVVIHGGAKGADSLAHEAVKRINIERRNQGLPPIKLIKEPAEWLRYRKAYGTSGVPTRGTKPYLLRNKAGHDRNRKMVAKYEPTHAILFHDDIAKSRGTAKMREALDEQRIPYYGPVRSTDNWEEIKVVGTKQTRNAGPEMPTKAEMAKKKADEAAKAKRIADRDAAHVQEMLPSDPRVIKREAKEAEAAAGARKLRKDPKTKPKPEPKKFEGSAVDQILNATELRAAMKADEVSQSPRRIAPKPAKRSVIRQPGTKLTKLGRKNTNVGFTDEYGSGADGYRVVEGLEEMGEVVAIHRKAKWKSREGTWGNPFTDRDPKVAVKKYKAWLEGEGPSVITYNGVRYSRHFVKKHLWKLKGYKLVCGGKPHSPCHGHVLADMAEDAYAKRAAEKAVKKEKPK